jgi:diaminopimelate decarboxylase
MDIIVVCIFVLISTVVDVKRKKRKFDFWDGITMGLMSVLLLWSLLKYLKKIL